MKKSPLILCLDIGTSACKGALVSPEGHLLEQSRESLSVHHRQGGVYVEQSPRELWTSLEFAIAALLKNRSLAGRVVAMSFSCQMGTHMLVTQRGKPLTPFISWMDRRAEQESSELSKVFTSRQMAQELGAQLPIVPSWPLPKLKWFSKYEPKLLHQARWIIQPKDWILWQLCGRWISDLSSLRGLRHQESGHLSESLFRWAGVRPDQVLPVAPADSIAGGLSVRWSRKWRLPANLPVVIGWNDLAAAVLGSTGLPDQVIGFDVSGTSEHLGVCAPLNTVMPAETPLSKLPLNGTHLLRYGVTSSSGQALQWYWERFRENPASTHSYGKFEREVSSTSPGAEGLLFLPYLNGERAPWFNPKARGSFYGITPEHRLPHFSRSILEGIALTLRSIQLRLGVQKSPEEFHVIGGGSAFSAWNQIKADILQARIIIPECSEAGCLGAAILAAKAIGWYVSLQQAGRAMVRMKRVFEPNAALTSFYEERHLQFEKLYRALEPIFDSKLQSTSTRRFS